MRERSTSRRSWSWPWATLSLGALVGCTSTDADFGDFEPGGDQADPYALCGNGEVDPEELCMVVGASLDFAVDPQLGPPSAWLRWAPGARAPLREPTLGVNRIDLADDAIALHVAEPLGEAQPSSALGFVGDLDGDRVDEAVVIDPEMGTLEVVGDRAASFAFPLQAGAGVESPGMVLGWACGADGTGAFVVGDGWGPAPAEAFAYPSTDEVAGAVSWAGTLDSPGCCGASGVVDLDADRRPDYVDLDPATGSLQARLGVDATTWVDGGQVMVSDASGVRALPGMPMDATTLFVRDRSGQTLTLLRGSALEVDGPRPVRGDAFTMDQTAAWAVGSFDGDARVDLAVLDLAGQLHFFTGGSDGFDERPGAEVLVLGDGGPDAPRAMLTVDLDDDGAHELLIYDGQRLTWIRPEW